MGLLSPTLGLFQMRGPPVQARRRLVMTFPVVPRELSRIHPQASSPSALRWGAGEEVRAQRPTTQPPVMKHQEDGESHQRRPSQTTLSSGYWEAEGKGRGPPCWGGGGRSGGAAPPRTRSSGLEPTAAEGQVTGGRRGRVCFPSSIRTARRIPAVPKPSGRGPTDWHWPNQSPGKIQELAGREPPPG